MLVSWLPFHAFSACITTTMLALRSKRARCYAEKKYFETMIWEKV